MAVRTGKKSFIAVVKAVNELARQCGYEVQFTLTSLRAKTKGRRKPRMNRRERWRRDLAWLENYLTDDDGLNRLRGNYVVVHDEKIVTIGPDWRLVSSAGSMKLGLAHEELLIVPIAVRDQDAEDQWEQTKMALGF